MIIPTIWAAVMELKVRRKKRPSMSSVSVVLVALLSQAAHIPAPYRCCCARSAFACVDVVALERQIDAQQREMLVLQEENLRLGKENVSARISVERMAGLFE